MPTEAEIFAKIHRSAVRLHTRPCTCTTGEYKWEPGKCFVCDGEGTVRDLERIFHASAGGLEVEDEPRKTCGRCEGSGLCDWCGGALEVVPDADSYPVIATVLVSWIQSMSITRAQEDFPRFSVQWDLLEAWLAHQQREAAPITEDQAKKVLEAMAPEIGPAPPSSSVAVLSGGALTDAELRELGVLEDGDAQGPGD
jgi:hypothetical protein